VAARTAQTAAPDSPARARCPTRHPRRRRRALACTCRQDPWRCVARKQGQHSQPSAAQACPPPRACAKASQDALGVQDLGLVVPAASAVSDPWACPSWAFVITAPQ
jgi:hypothetical protein